MVYTYSDTFIVNSLPTYELEAHESDAIKEVESLNINEGYFKEQLVKCRTYMLAARDQIEADGMAEKYKIYKDEFDRTLKLAIEAMARAAQGKEGAFGDAAQIAVGKIARG